MNSASLGPRRERGLTLFVALVLLVMVTLLAVSSFRVSNTNLKVIASMQGKGESVAAAQEAIESVLSSANFAINPDVVFNTPILVDLNGDSNPEYTVRIDPKPACLKARPTNPADLNITKPEDKPCFGTAQVGLASMASRCAETVWEISAKTKDTVTGAETIVRQGVSMRVSTTEAENSCK